MFLIANCTPYTHADYSMPWTNPWTQRTVDRQWRYLVEAFPATWIEYFGITSAPEAPSENWSLIPSWAPPVQPPPPPTDLSRAIQAVTDRYYPPQARVQGDMDQDMVDPPTTTPSCATADKVVATRDDGPFDSLKHPMA